MPTVVYDSTAIVPFVDRCKYGTTVLLSEPIPETNENLDQTETINYLQDALGDVKSSIEVKKRASVDGDETTYDDEIGSLDVCEEYGTIEWYNKQRNPLWLPIEHLVTEADRATGGKIVLLYQVPRAGAFIRARMADLPDVDWGDGNTRIGGSGDTYYSHTIQYDDLPASTTLENGFRQAIVTITPHDDDITYFIPYNDNKRYGASAVEAMAIGTNLKYFRLQNYENVEMFKILGENKNTEASPLPISLKYADRDFSNITQLTYFTKYLSSNPKVTIDITNVNKMSYMFFGNVNNSNITLTGTPTVAFSGTYMYGTMREGEIKAIDYSKCTSFLLFAYSSQHIERTPTIDMSSSTNNTRCFERCGGLQEVNIINCKSSISFYVCSRLPLHEIINFGLNSIVDMTGEDEQTVDIRSSMAGDELTNLGDTGTINHNGVDYTKDDIIALFTNLNWGVIL